MGDAEKTYGDSPHSTEITQQDVLLPQVKAAIDRHHQSGATLYKEGKPAEALEEYDRAITLGGEANAPWAVADKGDALLKLGRTKEAVAALERATELLPEDEQEWVFASLGVGYEKLAKEAFERVKKINSKNDVAESRLKNLGGDEVPEETKTTTEIAGLENEKLLPGEIYIRKGLDLLKEGKSQEAITYFNNTPEGKDLGLHIGGSGELINIEKLKTESDLNFALYEVARKARPSEFPAYRPAKPGMHHTFEDFPDDYDSELLSRFYYEIGLILAEEWLHSVQHQKADSMDHTAPLAGEDDAEVDILAYFDRYGMDLSANFISRYPERVEWFKKKHPDRAAELQL